MPNDTDRLAALEAKVQHLEDTVAIYQLISAYGPAVDRGDADATAALFDEAGTYDWGGAVENGRDGLKAMVRGERHQGIIASGAGHVLSQPRIEIAGDRATAVCYSVLFRKDGEAFVVFRLSSNRWELERIEGSWRVMNRVNRLLDGSPEARALLKP